jgi:hypothetical protein
VLQPPHRSPCFHSCSLLAYSSWSIQNGPSTIWVSWWHSLLFHPFLTPRYPGIHFKVFRITSKNHMAWTLTTFPTSFVSLSPGQWCSRQVGFSVLSQHSKHGPAPGTWPLLFSWPHMFFLFIFLLFASLLSSSFC